jgi:UDP-3-O-[3-hydroxymyristoyl] N-acetylglucosamine deacetylase
MDHTGMQKTLRVPIHCRGIGLHSGARIEMVLRPAAPNTGIRFRRRDLNGIEILADWRNVVESPLCTTLTNSKGASIGTIEHLMAAFAGLEIDNAIVDLDGPEVPVMDGSAAPFVFLMECAGLTEQGSPRRAIRVLKPVSVGAPGKSAALTPDDRFSLNFAIDFATSAIRRQELTLVPSPETFKHDLGPARTFGFLHEVESMRAAGLARGGSLDNAVVVNGDRVMNEEGLRFDDEFVRHKMLDAFGDLYLAGGPIIGRFHGHRAGHALNNQLLRTLFASEANWRWTTISDDNASLETRERKSLSEVLQAS